MTPTVKYTESEPQEGWVDPEFNDADWKTGTTPFGSIADRVKTMWSSNNIWIRKEFTVTDLNLNKLFLTLIHANGVEVYINGKKAFSCVDCRLRKYENFPVEDAIKTSLRKGKNVLAIRSTKGRNTALIDVGILNDRSKIRGI